MSRWNWVILAFILTGLAIYLQMMGEPARASNLYLVWKHGHQWGTFVLMLMSVGCCGASFFAEERSLVAMLAAVAIMAVTLLVLASLARALTTQGW